jgi:hypothetical protein
MRTHVLTLLVVAITFMSGMVCEGQTSKGDSEKSGTIAGQWGGDNATMEVNAGGATLDFGCGTGQITEPLKLDSEGKFSAHGTMSMQTAGPSRPDGEGSPATFTGVVKGDTIKLTVQIEGEKQGQPLTLTRGRKTKIMGCK